jgi:two-component system cell cycle response regulator
LREVARRLVNCTRTYDAVGRYGGEEFLIVASDCTPGDMLNIAKRMRESVSGTRITTLAGPVAVTLSLGVAGGVFRFDEIDAGVLTCWADQAMYAAKRLGKNRVETSTPALAG